MAAAGAGRSRGEAYAPLERAGAEEAGVGSAGGWDFRPLRDPGSGVKDAGPANPAAGAGARRGPKAPFNFNLQNVILNFSLSVEALY